MSGEWHFAQAAGTRVYVDGVDVSDKVTMTEGGFKIDGPVTTTSFTAAATYEVKGYWTSTSGEWIVFGDDPDMTDWPPDDIIDHYARQLAKRRPA